MYLGNLADLIFVFFDPMGQALCKRTLNIVEKLSETHADRMKYYLSKADEAGHEADRQVMLDNINKIKLTNGFGFARLYLGANLMLMPNCPTY